MPAGKDLTEPVFRSIIDSSYPESENVVSAELDSPALQDLSKLLEQARTDVKVSYLEYQAQQEKCSDILPRRASASSAS